MPSKPSPLPADLRPQRVPQVTAFLRQNGVENVELRRHGYYFAFFGPPTYGWMTSAVLTDRLDSMTLGEWLAKFRELEKLNKGNVLAKSITSAVKGQTKRGTARRESLSHPGDDGGAKASGKGGSRRAGQKPSGAHEGRGTAKGGDTTRTLKHPPRSGRTPA